MYLVHELYDKYYGLEADLEELTETNNYIPGNILKMQFSLILPFCIIRKIN